MDKNNQIDPNTMIKALSALQVRLSEWKKSQTITPNTMVKALSALQVRLVEWKKTHPQKQK